MVAQKDCQNEKGTTLHQKQQQNNNGSYASKFSKNSVYAKTFAFHKPDILTEFLTSNILKI